MNIKDLQNFGSEKLENAVFNPQFEADALLAHVLKKDRAFLYAHPRKAISNYQLSIFRKLLTRRQKKEPFVYLVGETTFYGLNFKVNKNVLIPRPETELLVEKALEKISPPSFPPYEGGPKGGINSVVDVGTGSGAIIISIAKTTEKNQESRIKNQEFIGIDISEKALRVAKANAKNLNAKIKFAKGSLLEPLAKKYKDLPHPWLIVSNPPYLTAKEVQKPKLKHEPQVALSGGKAGLELIEKLTYQFARMGKPGDCLMFEIGAKQAAQITKIKKQILPQASLKIYKDFSDWDRVVEINFTTSPAGQ